LGLGSGFFLFHKNSSNIEHFQNFQTYVGENLCWGDMKK